MRGNHWGLASTLVFCCAIVAGVAMTAGNANADECLSGPKGSTPQGTHWYYRIEHHTKRQCWYLGDEGKRATRYAASQARAADEPEKQTPTQKHEAMRPAVANARAELTKDVAVPFTTMPPIGQQQMTSATRDNPPPQASSPSSQPNNWSLAERWPDQNSNRIAQADIAAPPAPTPAQAQPVIVQQPTPQATPVSTATPTPAPDDSSDMLRIVVGILTATIALAAIVGRLILTHMRPRKRPAPRRAIWQTVDDDTTLPVYTPVRIRDPSLRARAEQDVEELLRALRYPEQQPATSPIASANRARTPRDRSGARA